MKIFDSLYKYFKKKTGKLNFSGEKHNRISKPRKSLKECESNLPYINAEIFERGLNGYLNYGLYNVTGEDSSGATVSVKINSINEASAYQQALNSGINEPLKVTAEEFKTPTEQQIEYALDLGITLPDDACHEDVSCLINRVTEDDERSPEEALAIYADRKGSQFSAWIGEKAFFNLLFMKLAHRDKLAFFIYCVYCYLHSKHVGNLDDSTDAELFYKFADQYSADKIVNSSLNKFEGESLIGFGSYEGKTGTSAYIVAAKFLLDNKNESKNTGE